MGSGYSGGGRELFLLGVCKLSEDSNPTFLVSERGTRTDYVE